MYTRGVGRGKYIVNPYNQGNSSVIGGSFPPLMRAVGDYLYNTRSSTLPDSNDINSLAASYIPRTSPPDPSTGTVRKPTSALNNEFFNNSISNFDMKPMNTTLGGIIDDDAVSISSKASTASAATLGSPATTEAVDAVGKTTNSIPWSNITGLGRNFYNPSTIAVQLGATAVSHAVQSGVGHQTIGLNSSEALGRASDVHQAQHITQGVAAGSTIGAAFGPIGAGIGAVAGGILSNPGSQKISTDRGNLDANDTSAQIY